MSAKGYAHPAYAEALAEFGRPIRLRRSGAWLLRRPIPDSPFVDAMGCYPLLACENWNGLEADLRELDGDLVSVVAVTDPFAPLTPEVEAAFNRGLTPYKEHFVVELPADRERFVHPQHRRKARRALEQVGVETAARPGGWLDEWCRLYDCLVERHGIRGISAFSHRSFERQLAVPGLVAIRAVHRGETVGIVLWLLAGEVGYYHLGAYSPRGYEVGAAFALFWETLAHLGGTDVRRLSLGAGAGVQAGEDDGLARFKRGWATGTRTVYLARHAGDPRRYDELCERFGGSDGFFPAYRAPRASAWTGSP